MQKIPVFRPHIHVDTVKHVTDALDVGWLGMGASTLEFEQRIAQFLGLDANTVAVVATPVAVSVVVTWTVPTAPPTSVTVPVIGALVPVDGLRTMTGAVVSTTTVSAGVPPAVPVLPAMSVALAVTV